MFAIFCLPKTAKTFKSQGRSDILKGGAVKKLGSVLEESSEVSNLPIAKIIVIKITLVVETFAHLKFCKFCK